MSLPLRASDSSRRFIPYLIVIGLIALGLILGLIFGFFLGQTRALVG